MIEISPYKAVGAVYLGMSQDEVVSVLGNPQSSGRDPRGNIVLRYEGESLTITPEGVVEVAILATKSVKIEGISIFSDREALSKLCQIDGDPKEVFGFIVLLKLGITMTGFHDQDESQKAVTAFSKGRWDMLRSEMKPFQTTDI